SHFELAPALPDPRNSSISNGADAGNRHISAALCSRDLDFLEGATTGSKPTPSSSCSNRIAGCHTVPGNLHEDARTARISGVSLIDPGQPGALAAARTPVCAVAPGQG